MARANHPARMAYLVLTVAVTVAAWFALAAMASPFLRVQKSGDSDSIRVENARNKSTPLPFKYAQRLLAIPGAASVGFNDLQMVFCGGDTVTVNAFGSIGQEDTWTHLGFSDEALRRWRDDPIGLLVSQADAKKCHWQLGQGVEPPDIQMKPIAFHISGIGTNQGEDAVTLAHYAYINREHALVTKPGQVLKFYVDASDPARNQALAARIDAEFAHDDPPVTAYPDTAREDARSRFGKVQYLVALVMGALFLCCLLVLASVMAHAASERRSQFGMVRALGFPRRVLAASCVLEVVGIVVLGAALGIGLGQVLLHYLPGWLQGRFMRISPAPWAWTLLPAWLALLALVALLRPCQLAWRAQPLDCRED